jgi:hypothetical protein
MMNRRSRILSLLFIATLGLLRDLRVFLWVSKHFQVEVKVTSWKKVSLSFNFRLA